MTPHRSEKPVATVEHTETGLTLSVYCVDLFAEQYDTLGLPQFVFVERIHETQTGQRVRHYKDKVWIVQTDKTNLYVKELSSE